MLARIGHFLAGARQAPDGILTRGGDTLVTRDRRRLIRR